MKMRATLLGILLCVAWTAVSYAQPHFTAVGETGLPYGIVLDTATLDGEDLVEGDEVAVFTGEMCVGVATVDGEWPLALTAWEGDPSQELEGFTAGDPITFRVWAGSPRAEWPATGIFTLGDGTYGYGAYSRADVSSSTISVEYFDPVESTGLPYALVVDDATIDQSALAVGDEIGVFDGFLCVGASVYTGSWPMALTAWEGDPAQELPGFETGNTMIFRVYSTGMEEEFGSIPEYSVGDGTFGFGAYSQLSLAAGTFVPNFFDPVEPTGLPYDFSITDAAFLGVDVVPGDEIGVFDGLLCVGAAVVTGDWPLTLTAWQANPTEELPGFVPGNPSLFVMYQTDTDEGHIGLPDYEVGDGTFGFGDGSTLSLNGVPFVAEHFNPVDPTMQDPHLIFINQAMFEGTPLVAGDEVAVFDGDLCVGAMIMTGDFPIPMLAWQADPVEDQPGFDPTHAMTFKMWSSGDDLESPTVTGYVQGDGTFGFLPYSVVTLGTPNAPDAFSLTAPADESAYLRNVQVRFEWDHSGDSDPGDTYTYNFYLTTDPEGFGNPYEDELTDTTFTWTTLPVDTTYFWTVSAVDSYGLETWANEAWTFTVSETSVGDNPAELPSAWAIQKVYPNPFNAATTIEIAVPIASKLTLEVYDILGRRVALLESGLVSAGLAQYSWGGTAASGVYFIRASNQDGWKASQRIVSLK